MLVDLSELIRDIVQKYENQNIITDFNSRIFFNGRKNLIQRCIINLIDNSQKYGKKIVVKIDKQTSNVIISIDDDGPGIPKSEYQNIVKPFYKIDKSRGDAKSSVGLGLSITSDIIRSHGGNIMLEKSPKVNAKCFISYSNFLCVLKNILLRKT